MRITRLITLAVAAVLSLAAAAAPASATTAEIIHWKFARALSAVPLDSTLVTLSTTSFDTSGTKFTGDIKANAVAGLDTAGAAGAVTAVGAIAHAPIGSMWVVIEVTGTMASLDSLYLGYQLSQGPVPSPASAYGGSGDQNQWFNWRWYGAQATSSQSATETVSGSQTFVFPIKAPPSAPGTYLAAQQMRYVLQGDTGASAKGFSTRGWIVTR